MFQTKVVGEIKTRILCLITFFFRKSCPLRDNAEKYYRTGQAADENTAHAHFTLGTKGYKRTVT